MRENIIDSYDFYIKRLMKLYIVNTFPGVDHAIPCIDYDITYNGSFENQMTWIGEVTVTLPEVRATYIIALDDYNDTLTVMDKNWNVLETYEDIRLKKSKEPEHYEKLDPNKDADFVILETLKDFVSRAFPEFQIKNFGIHNIGVRIQQYLSEEEGLFIIAIIDLSSMGKFNVSMNVFDKINVILLMDQRFDDKSKYYHYSIDVLSTGRRICQLCEITKVDFIALQEDQKKKGTSPS